MILALMAVQMMWAAQITVTNTSDDVEEEGSLRWAIEQAKLNSPAEITFSFKDKGTKIIQLKDYLLINGASVKIDASGCPDSIIIDGYDTEYGGPISNGIVLTGDNNFLELSNITFRNIGNCIYSATSGENMIINNCELTTVYANGNLQSDNSSFYRLIISYGEYSFNRSTFSKEFRILSGNVSVNDCVFSCRVDFENKDVANVKISKCVFSGGDSYVNPSSIIKVADNKCESIVVSKSLFTGREGSGIISSPKHSYLIYYSNALSELYPAPIIDTAYVKNGEIIVNGHLKNSKTATIELFYSTTLTSRSVENYLSNYKTTNGKFEFKIPVPTDVPMIRLSASATYDSYTSDFSSYILKTSNRFVVTSTEGSENSYEQIGTLRWACLCAGAEDTILFDFSPKGKKIINGDNFISRAAVDGSSYSDTIIIRGNNQSAGGPAGLICSGPFLKNIVSEGHYKGIEIKENCFVQKCVARNNRIGFNCTGSETIVDNCLSYNNSGSGIVRENSSASLKAIKNSRFYNNFKGISIGSKLVENCDVFDNSIGMEAIYPSYSIDTIRNCWIAGNDSIGLNLYNYTNVIHDCVIGLTKDEKNTYPNGTGVYFGKSGCDAFTNNVVSGNRKCGIIMSSANTINVKAFCDNYIGTNHELLGDPQIGNGEDGMAGLPNSSEKFAHNYFGNNKGAGIRVASGGSGKILIDSCFFGGVGTKAIANGTSGIYFPNGDSKNYIFKNCQFSYNTEYGITFKSYNLFVDSCSFIKNLKSGINFQGSNVSPKLFTVSDSEFDGNMESAIEIETEKFNECYLSNNEFLHTVNPSPAIKVANPYPVPEFTSCKMTEKTIVIEGKIDTAAKAKIELFYTSQGEQTAEMLVDSFYTNADGTFSDTLDRSMFVGKSIIGFTATATYGKITSPLSDVVYPELGKVDLTRTEFYVKIDGYGDGSTWDKAMSPQTFAYYLPQAKDGSTFYVAEGRYLPISEDENGYREYKINSSVSIIGGYPDTAKTGDVPDPKEYKTIFTGDPSGDDYYVDGIKTKIFDRNNDDLNVWHLFNAVASSSLSFYGCDFIGISRINGGSKVVSEPIRCNMVKLEKCEFDIVESFWRSDGTKASRLEASECIFRNRTSSSPSSIFDYGTIKIDRSLFDGVQCSTGGFFDRVEDAVIVTNSTFNNVFCASFFATPRLRNSNASKLYLLNNTFCNLKFNGSVFVKSSDAANIKIIGNIFADCDNTSVIDEVKDNCEVRDNLCSGKTVGTKSDLQTEYIEDVLEWLNGAPVLKNNGGFTPTVALKSDKLSDGKSIRFPRLDDVLTDQRGVSRLEKTCMGAYEIGCGNDTTIATVADTINVGTKIYGQTFTEVGVHDGIFETLQNVNGCDSVVKHTVVVKPTALNYYVKRERVNKGDGSNWDNAMNDNDFITYLPLAPEGATFHVAAGEYLKKSDKLKSISVKNDVTIIGGYPADATKGAVSDPKKYSTHISLFRELTSDKDAVKVELYNLKFSDFSIVMNNYADFTLIVDKCKFQGYGTGSNVIYSGNKSVIKLTDSYFSGENNPTTLIAGMYGGTVDISGCTFAYYRKSDSYLIDISYPTYISLINSTIVYNVLNGVIGGAPTHTNKLLNNTIVGNKFGNEFFHMTKQPPVFEGNIYAENGYEFVSTFSNTNIYNKKVSDILEGTVDETSGLFSPELKDNGGFTPTVALKSDKLPDDKSIRFPRLDDVLTDQRGVSRLPETCMGAYEIGCGSDTTFSTDTINVGTKIYGQTFTKVGVHDSIFETLQTAIGCDSVVMHKVVVKPDPTKLNYYVKMNKENDGDGRDWDNAMSGEDFATYLPLAPDGATFYVAEGEYKLCTSISDFENNYYNRSFFIQSNVSILGGYSNNSSTNTEIHDNTLYPTIFSGDCGEKNPSLKDYILNSSIDLWDIKGSDSSVLFYIADGCDVKFKDLFFTSSSLSSIVAETGTLIVEGCIFQENTSGIANDYASCISSKGSLMLTDCSFEYNKCQNGYSGLIYFADECTIKNCTFSYNYGAYSPGGFIGSYSRSKKGKLSVIQSIFINNNKNNNTPSATLFNVNESFSSENSVYINNDFSRALILNKQTDSVSVSFVNNTVVCDSLYDDVPLFQAPQIDAEFSGNILCMHGNEFVRCNGNKINSKYNLFSELNVGSNWAKYYWTPSATDIVVEKREDAYALFDDPSLSAVLIKDKLSEDVSVRFPLTETSVTTDQRGVERLDSTCMGAYEMKCTGDTTFLRDTIFCGESFNDSVFTQVGRHDLIETFTDRYECDSVVLLCLFVKPVPSEVGYFVKMERSGMGDGSSWDDAMNGEDFAAVLNLVEPNSKFHIAEGEYLPVYDIVGGIPSKDYDKVFFSDKCVSIDGGYSDKSKGTELNADPAVYKTILSGDNEGNTPAKFDAAGEYADYRKDDCHAIFQVETKGEGSIVISGIEFFGSYAHNSGGSAAVKIQAENASFSVDRCTFTQNNYGMMAFDCSGKVNESYFYGNYYTGFTNSIREKDTTYITYSTFENGSSEVLNLYNQGNAVLSNNTILNDGKTMFVNDVNAELYNNTILANISTNNATELLMIGNIVKGSVSEKGKIESQYNLYTDELSANFISKFDKTSSVENILKNMEGEGNTTQNNGGFTPTIALKSDVLADGTSLRLPVTKTIINDDQRGVDRLPATCIGSYETIEVSTVEPFVMDAVYDTICGGLDYVNGNWSLSAENLPESGDEVFKNVIGSSLACDTVEILYLHIIESHNVKITYTNASKTVCADGPGGSVAFALEQNNNSSWSVTLCDSTKESVDSEILSETSQYFIFDKLMPGTYSINVHNTQLCSTDTTFNITVDNIQKLHVEAPDTLVTLCRKESTADCEIKAYGYNSSMTIYLDDVALSENLELGNSYISSTESDLATIYVYALQPGIHHLTAVNSCGDKYDLKEIMVIAPDELQMSISDKMIDGFKCSKDRGFVEFAISGGFEPIFSVASDSVNVEKNVDGQSTIKIENLPDGKYHFLLRSNLEECSDSLFETVYVSTPDTLNLSLMSNAEADKLCEDGTLIKATVTGENEEYLFTWVTPQGDSIVTKNSVLNNVGAGTYICKVTDSNNCSSVYETVKLSTVDDLDQIEVKSISQQSVCFNEDAFELKIDYTNNNKQQAVTALLNDRVSNKLVKSATSKLEKGALILDKVPSGNYNLIVRYGTSDCEISSDKFVDTAITVVRKEGSLSINNPVIYPQTCYSKPDGKVVITVNGWGKYNAFWNNKSTTPSKIEGSVATFEFGGLGGGEYHFVVKDDCGGSDSVVISSKQMPIPVPVSMNVKVLKDTVYCAREKSGEIELSLSGGIEGHSSLTLDGEEIKYLSTQKISTLGKGIHKIVYTSENEACSGDSKYISFKIKGPDTLFAQFGLTGFDCDAAEMFADVTGETAPYIYQWSDGLTTSRPSFRKKSPYPVESGKTYSLKVKDFAGCDSMVTTFTVPTADVLPQLLLDPIGYPEKCHNGNNGSADIWFSTGNIKLPFGMVVTVVVSKNGVVVKQIEKTLSDKEAYLVQLVDCLAPGLYDVTVHYGNAKCVMEDKSVSGTFEVEALKKLEYKSDLTVLPQTCETPNGSVTVLVDGWNNSHIVTLYRKVSFNILFSRLNFDIPVFSQHMSPKVEGQLATLTIGALPSAKYYLQVSDVCGNKIKTKTFYVEKKLTEVSDLKIEKVMSCFNRPNGVASFNVTGWTNQHVCKVARVENDKYVDVILPNPVTIDEENKKAFFRIDTLKTGTWHVRVVNECGEDKVYDKITMPGIKKYELIVEPLSRLKLDCPYDTNGMILLTAKGGRPYAPILAGFEEKVTYQVPDGYTYFEKEKIVYEEKKEPEMEMYVIKDTLVIGVGDTTFSERYDYRIKYDEDGNIVYRTWIDTVVVFEKDSMPKYKNEDSIRFVDISSKVKTLNVYMNGLLDFRKYALVSNLKPGNYSLIFKSDLEGCHDSVETKVSVVAPKNMIFDKEILPISCSPRHDAEIAIRPHREGYVYNGNLVVQPSSSYMYYHPVGVLKDGNFKLLQATDEIGILDAKIAVAANEVKNDGLYYIMLSNNFSHQQYTPVPRQDDDFIYGDPSIVSVEWFKEVNGNLNKLNMLRADSCTDFMDDTSFVKRYYLNGSEIGDLPVWGESPFGNSFELIPSSDNFDACYIPGVQTVANLSAGQYVVRVTDNKGCVYNEKIELKNPQEALKIDSVIFNAEDAYCDPLARRIRVHASGGWGSYTYLFTNEDEPESYGNSLGYKTTEDSIVISQDNIVRSGFAMSAFLDPGLYKVMVMDKFGCIATADEKYRVKGDISIPKKDTIVPKCPRMDVVVPLSLNGSVDGTLFDVDVYTRQDTLYTPITSPFAKDLKVENGAITLIVPSKEKGINKYGFFVHESGKECGGGYVEIIVNDTLPKMVFSLKELYSSLCYSENTGKVDLYAQGGVLPYSINIWKDKDGEKVQYGNVTVSSLIEQKLSDTVSLYYTTVEDLDAGVFNMTLVDSRECPQELENPITIIQPEPLKAEFFTSGICPHVSQVDSDNLIEAVKNDGWSPEEGNGFVFAQNVTGGVAPYSFSCEGKTSDPDDTRLAISVNGELGKVYDCVVYDSNNCEYKGTAEFKDAPFQEPIIDFVTSQWSKESDIITFIDICYTKENDTEKLILSDSVTYEFNDEVLELLDKRMFIYDIEGGSVNAQTLIKERGSRSFEDSFFDANFTRLVDKDQAKRMNFAQLKREYKTTSTGSHYMESLTDVVSTPVKMTAYFSGCAYEMSCSKIYIAPSAYNIGDKVGVLPRGGEIVDFYVAPTVAENTSTAYITLDLQPGNVANTTVDLQLFSMDGGTLVQTVPLKPGNKDASGYYKIEYMFSGLDNLASGVYIVIMNVNGKDKRYSYIIKK